MKTLLSIIAAAGLLLYPFTAFASDYGPDSSQSGQTPPVAQSLVREGDFAVKLAAELKLGTPTEEAVAEDLLVKAGVVPLNGWLSDYPMTPQIVGQLKDSIAKAADDGKLPMKADEATQTFAALVGQMSLPTPESAGKGTEAEAQAIEPSPTVINNYYYDEGPPIITYYPPPVDYGYLYDWVPYPVWWWGFWFPGFYICHNFTTTIIVTVPVVIGGPIRPRPVIVTNVVVDPVTKTVAHVDPVTRTGRGGIRPVTTLRTQGGRTFRSMTELRQVARVGGLDAGKTGMLRQGAFKAGGFRTPAARRSAEAIYSRSMGSRGPSRRSEGNGAYRPERRPIRPSAPERRSGLREMRGAGRAVGTFARPSSGAPLMREGRGTPMGFKSGGRQERSGFRSPFAGGRMPKQILQNHAGRLP